MKKILIDFLSHNNGMIRSSQARKLGVANKELQRLVYAGDLERIAHGLYMLPEQFPDEYYIAQYRCPKGVFSHETALYFHGLSDRTPLQVTLTIPTGYNTKLLKNQDYKFYYCKQEIHGLGITTVKTSFGNTIEVYNSERTICDCIKKKVQLDEDIVLFAVKEYLGKGGNDYARLLKYAEIFKIRNIVKQYMEVIV